MVSDASQRTKVKPMDWQFTAGRYHINKTSSNPPADHLLNQNPINRGQVYAGENGRKDIKADPSTQMMLPTVQQMIRELRNLVAQIPAMSSEMICRERPAQSSKAA